MRMRTRRARRAPRAAPPTAHAAAMPPRATHDMFHAMRRFPLP